MAAVARNTGALEGSDPMYAPPEIIETEIFARLPDKFRRKDPDNAWVIVNRRGLLRRKRTIRLSSAVVR